MNLLKAVKSSLWLLGLCLTLLVLPLLLQGKGPDDQAPDPTTALRRDTFRVNKLIDLCWSLRSTDPEWAVKYGGYALELARELRFASGEARALNNIGVVHHLQGRLDEALVFYERAAGVYTRAGHLKGTASVLSNIASVYQASGDYERSMAYYTRSISVARKAGDQQRIAIALGSIGILYYDQGFHAKALTCYLQSLSIRERLDDKQGMAYALGNIGLIYDAQKNYPKALEYYNRSLRIRQQLNDQQGIATSLINIGMVYYAQGRFDESLDYFTHATRISEECGFKRGLAASLINTGDVYREKAQYREAALYFEKALRINTELGDQQGIANACHSLGIVNRQTGQISSALQWFEKSLKLATTYGFRELRMNNYRELSELYAKQGLFEQAFEKQSLYIGLKDSIYNEESMVRLADLQVKYETEKKEREIRELQRERELQALKFKNNNILFTMSGIVFVLVLGLSLAIFYMSRHRQKVRQITMERESERALQESEKKYKDLERMLPQIVMEMEERERKRFAKDLHDGLGPLLSSIKIYVNELQDQELAEEERKEMLRYVNELIDEAVNDTRTIANNLMPSMIADYGLIKALKNFCEKLQASKAIHVMLSMDVMRQRYERTLEIVLYRVVLELINNTLKHASAKNIEIHLFETVEVLELNYKDDGVGFDLGQSKTKGNGGMGLSNIVHRVQSVNGHCEFRSEAGKGMMVSIEIRRDKFDFTNTEVS